MYRPQLNQQMPFHRGRGNGRQKHYLPRGPPRPNHGYYMPSSFDDSSDNYNATSGNEYWCETCDRGFGTSIILENHIKQHEQCKIDGCKFVAHPKVITKHIQMQHSTGLYSKIAKSDDPEEIRKWREERKKKYPTKVNIDKKAAEVKEKVDRGEKMGLMSERNNRHKSQRGRDNTQRGFKRGHGSSNENKPFSKENRDDKCYKRKSKPPPPKKPKLVPPTEDSQKLKPFAGIQDLIGHSDSEGEIERDECDFVIEDDDVADDIAVIKQPVLEDKPVVCGALSSLMCNYDSTSDDDTKPDNTKSNLEPSVKINNELGSTVGKPDISNCNTNAEKSDDDSGPEEIKTVKLNLENIVRLPPIIKPEHEDKKYHTKNKQEKRPVFKKHKSKLPSTLLQKLLFKEIRHERNIILQCVRYTVENKYFDK